MLLSEQNNSAAITDKINFMYSRHLLQEAARIGGLPETEEERQKYGPK